jgi:hypothetical protein
MRHGSIITTTWCRTIIPMVIALSNANLLERKVACWVIGCMTRGKKFKAGVFSDDRINLLSDLQFDFSMQTNVVEKS